MVEALDGDSVVGAPVQYEAQARVTERLIAGWGEDRPMSVINRIKSLCGVPDVGLKGKPDGSERRLAIRYPTVPPMAARLGWWENDVQHETKAEILDIASDGALLTVDQLPPNDAELWFLAEADGQDEWVEIKVAWRVEPNQLGCLFPEGCPYDVFKMAQGVRVVTYVPAPHKRVFNSRQWR